MSKTIAQIIAEAEEIRVETDPNGNTAERVGTAIKDVAEHLEEVEEAVADVDSLQETVAGHTTQIDAMTDELEEQGEIVANLEHDMAAISGINVSVVGKMQNFLRVKLEKGEDYSCLPYGIANTGKFDSTPTNLHGCMAVREGDVYYLANESEMYDNIRYAFATSTESAANTAIPKVDGTGVVIVEQGTTATIIVPTDCYLLFNTNTSLYKSTLYGLSSETIQEIDRRLADIEEVRNDPCHTEDAELVDVLSRCYGYKGYIREQGASATPSNEAHIVKVTEGHKLKVYTNTNGSSSYPIYAIMFFATDDVELMKRTDKAFFIETGSIEVNSVTTAWYELDVPNGAVCAVITNCLGYLSRDEVVIQDTITLFGLNNQVENFRKDVEGMKKHINVCILGYSWSMDSWSYVPFILQNFGITCRIEVYYRGSGSLTDLYTQWENTSTTDIAEYDGTQHPRYHFWCDTRLDNIWHADNPSGYRRSAKEIVEMQRYDFIVMNSIPSLDLSVDPYVHLEDDIALINASHPYPYKLCWQIPFLRNKNEQGFDGTPAEARAYELQFVKNAVEKMPFSAYIPVGTAVYNGQANAVLDALGQTSHMRIDNVHLHDGIPCYLAACTVVEAILRMLGEKRNVMNEQTQATEDWVVAHAIKDRNNGNAYPACGYDEGDDILLNTYLAHKAAIVANNHPWEICQV